jgi:Rad3-related DNA helicase
MKLDFPPALKLFPHEELRAYQAHFLRFIERNPRSIVHAPVGFGKTVMSLISTLPLISSSNYQMYIFVRTKAQIFHVFLKEIQRLAKNEKYGYLTVMPLILKADMCIIRDDVSFFHRGICGQIKCKHLELTQSIPEEDFPTIVEQVPLISYTDKNDFDVNTFKNTLSEFGCPYYVIRRCLPYANIIITTHTYLQNKSLQVMFSQLMRKSSFKNKICIIDEGHNFGPVVETELLLPDIYSAKKIIPLKILDQLHDLIYKNRGRVDRPKGLSLASLDAYLDHQSELTLKQKSNLQLIKDFVLSEGDLWISEPEKLVQVNPYPEFIFEFINTHFNRIILMSGTFLPLSSYKKFYRINYPSLKIPATFQNSLNGILYHRQFTSKYSERSTNTYFSMGKVITRLHKNNPFSTIVFATSHELKHKILIHTDIPNVYIENPNENPHFLDNLHQKIHECIFAVQNGKLAEGIEVISPKTNRSLLTLIIIAGIPYPRPDATNTVVKSFFKKKWGIRTANHLSHLPVTRGISQAIGRGIRSERDFAASIILDHRAVRLLNMLPKTVICRNIEKMYATYDSFFSRMKSQYKIHS